MTAQIGYSGKTVFICNKCGESTTLLISVAKEEVRNLTLDSHYSFDRESPSLLENRNKFRCSTPYSNNINEEDLSVTLGSEDTTIDRKTPNRENDSSYESSFVDKSSDHGNGDITWEPSTSPGINTSTSTSIDSSFD